MVVTSWMSADKVLASLSVKCVSRRYRYILSIFQRILFAIYINYL